MLWTCTGPQLVVLLVIVQALHSTDFRHSTPSKRGHPLAGARYYSVVSTRFVPEIHCNQFHVPHDRTRLRLSECQGDVNIAFPLDFVSKIL